MKLGYAQFSKCIKLYTIVTNMVHVENMYKTYEDWILFNQM